MSEEHPQERDDSPLGVDRAWPDVATDLEEWLDTHYPVEVFGDKHLMHPDNSGVDTTNGYGPAAVRAYRIAIALARCQDVGKDGWV